MAGGAEPLGKKAGMSADADRGIDHDLAGLRIEEMQDLGGQDREWVMGRARGAVGERVILCRSALLG